MSPQQQHQAFMASQQGWGGQQYCQGGYPQAGFGGGGGSPFAQNGGLNQQQQMYQHQQQLAAWAAAYQQVSLRIERSRTTTTRWELSNKVEIRNRVTTLSSSFLAADFRFSSLF